MIQTIGNSGTMARKKCDPKVIHVERDLRQSLVQPPHTRGGRGGLKSNRFSVFPFSPEMLLVSLLPCPLNLLSSSLAFAKLNVWGGKGCPGAASQAQDDGQEGRTSETSGGKETWRWRRVGWTKLVGKAELMAYRNVQNGHGAELIREPEERHRPP